MIGRLAPTFLDLEVEALLLEVLRDPSSKLLRSSPRQRSLAWLEPDPRVSSSAAGLTLAERQLLQNHREEVAWLLRQLAFEQSLEDRLLGSLISLDLPGGKRVAHIGRHELLERGLRAGRELSSYAPSDAGAADAALELEVLHRSIPEPLSLLLASMRLVPSPVTRIDMAYVSLRRGRDDLAMQIAERVAQDADELGTWVPARSLQAVVHARRGQLEDARRVFAENAEIAPGWPGETLSWYTSSIQVGDLESALSAAAIIDDQWEFTDSVINTWIGSVLQQRRSGAWSATPDATALIPELLGRVGVTSRWVAHVF